MQARWSLISGAALLVVGLVGFGFTLPYEQSETRLAPLPAVDAFTLRILPNSEPANAVAAFDNLVPSPALEAATVGLPEPTPSTSEQPIARPVAQVAAAAVSTVQNLPAPTAIATPTPSPVAQREPQPSGARPASTSTAEPSPAVTNANTFGAFGADSVDVGSTGPGATLATPNVPIKRVIDPMRPMPR